MIVKGTNRDQTRPYNRRVVLETVRLRGPMSRADISRLTDLTPPAVNDITRELEKAGLLRSEGRRRTARGQPPVDYIINPEGGYSIGLQLDRDRLVGVMLDLAGDPRARTECRIEDPRPDAALPSLIAVSRQLITEAGINAASVIGAGLVLPGPFDSDDPDDPMRLPGWRNTDPARALMAAIDLPVIVVNDANAAAVGERLHGAARDLATFCYVFLGHGLGAGFFLNGEPFEGSRGNAGELGHMVVDFSATGPAQRLEHHVSLHALGRWFAERGREAPRPEDLADLVAANDDDLNGWMDAAAAMLRPGLASLAALLDPQAILIGGLVPTPFIDVLLARLDGIASDHLQLIAATAGPDVGALGAAALPVFHHFVPGSALLTKDTSAANGAGRHPLAAM
ncbi:MAG: ROK family transcriptional regulator [Pseudomonadota bacterium]